MFFHQSQFSKYIGDDLANLVSKIANEIIDNQGVVLYGNAYEDGRVLNFGTDKKSNDTHVAIAIGVSAMGFLSEPAGPLKSDDINKDDLINAQKERIRLLENQLGAKK